MRVQEFKFIQEGNKRTGVSPITGRLAVYSKCQAIQAVDFFTYDLNALKNAYNQDLADASIDAYVEECKEIRGTFQSNIVNDLWVAGESPIAAATVVAILVILAAITASVIVTLSAASSFIERVFPQPKFYSPDGQVFTSLAAYLTYMQNIYNPSVAYPYTCPYCGQGFTTQEELDAHVQDCPWKEGPPNGGDNIWRWLTIAVFGFAAIIIVPKMIDAFKS